MVDLFIEYFVGCLDIPHMLGVFQDLQNWLLIMLYNLLHGSG